MSCISCRFDVVWLSIDFVSHSISFRGRPETVRGPGDFAAFRRFASNCFSWGILCPPTGEHVRGRPKAIREIPANALRGEEEIPWAGLLYGYCWRNWVTSDTHPCVSRGNARRIKRAGTRCSRRRRLDPMRTLRVRSSSFPPAVLPAFQGCEEDR